MSIVEIEGLTFSFSRKEDPVINDFSFSMKKGEIVGILGQSGSGKKHITSLDIRIRNADERNH
jgi:iron(III) transport system ATP-binding protein